MIKYGILTEEEIYRRSTLASLDDILNPVTKVKRNCLQADSKSETSRFHIKLCSPVINYVKAGNNAMLIAKLIGKSQGVLTGITQFKLGIDKATGEIIEPDVNVDPDTILMGPVAILELIDRFDLEQGRLDAMGEIVAEFCTAQSREKGNYPFKIIKGVPSDIRVFGDYFLHDDGRLVHSLMGKYFIEDLEYLIHQSIKSSSDRICVLLNMGSKDRLYSFLEEYIVIVPPAMRPKIDKRQDPLTKMYLRVYRANDNLDTLLMKGNYTLQEYTRRYLALDLAVKSLQYEADVGKKGVLSVSERLAGKNRHIRSMLGKRVDFSGRSVIIPNPDLGVNEVGVPVDMIPKLFRYHHLKEEARTLSQIGNILRRSNEENTRKIQELGILSRVPVMLNRAPTLHSLGWQAFWVVPTHNRAIELSVTACDAYNADFDGDQMGIHVPISEQAILEAVTLMMPSKNPYKPSTGKPIITPRHEMLLGLHYCTKDWDKNGNNVNCGNLDELKEAVYNQDIKIYDVVRIPGIGTDYAGRQLVKWCLPRPLWSSIPIINKDTIVDLVENILKLGENVFIESMNKLTKTGFKIASLYTPTVNALNGYDERVLKEPFQKFHENMEGVIELYQLGLMDDAEYLRKLNQELTDTSDEIKNRAMNGALDKDEAFVVLALSGARGSLNNALQMYSHIGLVKKNSIEQFPVVLEHSYTDGLTATEHFMTAFGAREDSMSRSMKTADTGYTSRLMVHTAADLIVRMYDCHTDKGLDVTKSDIAQHIYSNDPEIKRQKVEEIFINIITGKYTLDSNTYITPDMARQIAQDRDSILIRSVLTCKAGCCVLCYGEDVAHHAPVVVGHSVGVIGAQAIGELGTQASMDTFQHGGVVSESDMNVEFDRMKAFINVSDISNSGKYPLYDPIAWNEGIVVEKPINSHQKEITIGDSKKRKRVPSNLEVKEFVTKGESLCVRQGDLYVNEVLEYRGLEEAQKYLLYAIYTSYQEKDDIDFKHFECLVSSMTLYMIIDNNGRPDLRVGKCYAAREVYSGNTDTIRTRPILKGIQQIPLYRHSLLSNIDLERVKEGISMAYISESTEDFQGALEATLFGIQPNIGSSYPNYIVDRLAQMSR